MARKVARKKKEGKVSRSRAERPPTGSPSEEMLVQARQEDLTGKYCNFAVFKHSKREFVLDFVWRLENTNILVSRIITSPQHAKAIHDALGKNIQSYETANGTIADE